MPNAPRAAALMAALLAAAPAAANERLPATLAGHAFLPAFTLIAPPADAPREAWISGRFAAGPTRVDRPYSVPGDTGPAHGNRQTGISLPFIGQPLQGFSGFSMTRHADGSIYAMIDNGFGTRRNSPDALLYFVRVAPNWQAGTIDVRQTVFLRDPDRVIPYRIVNDGTAERYLTGQDFDPESIQVIGDTVWIGEEFGPFLIRATLDGRVTGVFPTLLDGREIRSPDNPALSIPADAGRDWIVPRSAGYEGMAATPDGSRLWAMIERPILGANGQPEGNFLRVLEFDTAAARWTGRQVRYRLDDGATAIGDFNMIDATRALVIERDNGEGTADRACPEGQRREDCFNDIARFKRVVLIDFSDANANGPVRKIAYVDLMRIQDPNNRSRVPLNGGVFTFPFFTIENVDRVDAEHIVVGNDNNLPFSSSRDPNRADGNELILLRVPELLNAR